MSITDNEQAQTTAPVGVSFTEFDTGQIEQSLRYEAWRENMGVLFDLSDPEELPPDADYQAKLILANLGDALMCVASAPSQVFSRDTLRTIRDEQDTFLVQLFLRGGGIMPDKGKIVAGDMLVIDLRQPHEMLNSDFENLTLVVPRSLSLELSALLEKIHSTRIPGNHPMVRFMGEHFLSLQRNLPDMNMTQAGIAVQGTLGLMQGWLAQDGTLCEHLQPAAAEALGEAVRRYIERNLAKPLQVEALAATFRVSKSQIYRLFKPYDGVARYTWERRLQHSLRLLSLPRFASMSIANIAYECGFSSESHFSRRFRDRFGITPGQARARALEQSIQLQETPSCQDQYSTAFRDLITSFTALPTG